MNGGIINFITKLHLVGCFYWIILQCTDPKILKKSWNNVVSKGLIQSFDDNWIFFNIVTNFFPDSLSECSSNVVTVLLKCKEYCFKWKRVSNICSYFLQSKSQFFNPLNPELNPICYLLALLGAHHFLHVSRIRVKSLTFRLLMSYIYIYIWSTHSWCF